MSSYMRISVLSGRSGNSVKAWLRLIPGFRPEVIERVGSFFSDIAGGIHSGHLNVATNAVPATGTLTLSSFNSSDTITVPTGTFGAGSFVIGASDTATAANAAAAINAAGTCLISATSVGPVITISSSIPGTIGNYLPISISGGGTASGPTLLGGSEDPCIKVYNGIKPNGQTLTI